ncbi:MAG: hypothetical protein WCA10_22680 [Terracidiphilus sp.]
MAYIETEYDNVWREIYRKRKALMERHAELEVEIGDVSNQLSHLNEILIHLEPLAGLGNEKTIIGMGITDAIRWTLKNVEGQRMSPTDIRDELLKHGYDMTGLTVPMSSIYKVLSRLADQKKPEITRETEGNNVFYSWIVTDPARALADSGDVT